MASVLQYDTLNAYTVARWISPDPYGQFTSPYVGMGNNPVSGVDPDGGWSLVGSAIGSLVGLGLSYAVVDEDHWYNYVLGGFVAGGIGGELAHSSHDYTSHASNAWDRFTSVFGEGKAWGAGKTIYNRYAPNPKWVDVGHSNIPASSQGVKQEWCVYASSERIEKALGGKRTMKDFAKLQNGGQPLDKGVNTYDVGRYYAKNFPKNFKGQGVNTSNPPPSSNEIASQMKKGNIVSTVIHEGLDQDKAKTKGSDLCGHFFFAIMHAFKVDE
jgi:hypothetical protein